MSEPPAKAGGFWTHWSGITAGVAALVTAMTGLITGLAALGVIGSNANGAAQQSGGPPPTTTESTTQTTSISNPTPAEKRLLELVPFKIKPRCDRQTEKVSADSVAAVICRSPPTLDQGYVSYALFKSQPTLNKHIVARKSLGNKDKQCGMSAAGASTYQINDKEAGWLICYLDDADTAWIEWTSNAALVYAYAHRTDDNWEPLFEFWESQAGPAVP